MCSEADTEEGDQLMDTGRSAEIQLLTDIKALLGGAGLSQYVDGLEALATLLNGYVDGLETLQQNWTTTHRLQSAAGTVNAANVKASPGVVYQVSGYNAAASGRWLKLYNKATAPDENDTPRKTIYLPPSAPFVFDVRTAFATGIGYRMTTGSADGDTGALTAADVLGFNLDYV